MSFATLVFAEEPQIKLGGSIAVKGWYFDNVAVSDYSPEKTGSAAYYKGSAVLTVDAKISDNLKGYMELETGDKNYSGSYTWGTQDVKADASLWFRQLWIQYTGSGLLGVPSGLKVGHQLLTLGEKQFLNLERFGTDAILVFTEPTKELFLAALTAKGSEGVKEDNTDDLDIYVLLGTYKLDKNNTIGVNYTYANLPEADLKFSNLGFHANGLLAGALTYAAELDFQFGSFCDDGGLCTLGTESVTDKTKYKGWGLMAKAGYKLDPVNLRASFGMGSGDSDYNDDKIGDFQTVMSPEVVSPTSRPVHYTQIYERTIRTAALERTLGAGSRSTGIANTTYYNLGLDLAATKDLTLALDGFILRATKNGAWEDEMGHSVSKNVGTEVDFKGTYKITKNLSYYLEAGIFSPGSFYEDTGTVDEGTVTQVMHGVSLTF